MHVRVASPRDNCCHVACLRLQGPPHSLVFTTEVLYIPPGTYHLIRIVKKGLGWWGFKYKRTSALKTCQGFQHTASIIRPEWDVSAGNVNLSQNQREIINNWQQVNAT